MARAKSKSSGSNLSLQTKTGQSESTKRTNHGQIADEVIELLEEIDVREELRQIIKQKDVQYKELLGKYSALKESTLSKLHTSIDRITLEGSKLQQIDSEPFIEQLNQEVQKLNVKLQAMDRLKSENDMLKNETRALHIKVRSLEKKLTERPASPPKQAHIDNASAQLIIDLYQCMLGMRIIPQTRNGDEAQSFNCRMVDRQTRRVVEFTVMATDSEEIECCPTRIDVGDSRECDFLKEGPIQFDLDLMSRFTKKLLTAIQQQ